MERLRRRGALHLHDLDACCRDHNCVEKKGMMSVKGHEKLKNCMRKVKKARKVGFSKKCPYDMAMATMAQGWIWPTCSAKLHLRSSQLHDE
ncbi:hypothetical protein ZEAMMB73_Zm00001d018554 [Zea mays]|uniref:Uncharacterized protein n=1 Tax=Zea mays TaxID=4577 RepID=A0A1D6HQA6_MAIZE|nr:hypothetical protein ZEAMMB73_Zm00001d018554 [Zea mays]